MLLFRVDDLYLNAVLLVGLAYIDWTQIWLVIV